MERSWNNQIPNWKFPISGQEDNKICPIQSLKTLIKKTRKTLSRFLNIWLIKHWSYKNTRCWFRKRKIIFIKNRITFLYGNWNWGNMAHENQNPSSVSIRTIFKRLLINTTESNKAWSFSSLFFFLYRETTFKYWN